MQQLNYKIFLDCICQVIGILFPVLFFFDFSKICCPFLGFFVISRFFNSIYGYFSTVFWKNFSKFSNLHFLSYLFCPFLLFHFFLFKFPAFFTVLSGFSSFFCAIYFVFFNLKKKRFCRFFPFLLKYILNFSSFFEFYFSTKKFEFSAIFFQYS